MPELSSRRRTMLLILIVLILQTILSACSALAPEPTPTLSPTETATVAPSATATSTATATATATNTPAPTATATPTRDRTATAQAMETRRAAEATVQAEADLALVSKTLEMVGVSPEGGHLAWAQRQEMPLVVTGYGEYHLGEVADLQILRDFVISTDVTWESTSGLAGCSVYIRSEENVDIGAYYSFVTLRLSGAPAWDVEYWDQKMPVSNLTGSIQFSNDIRLDNGATNQYVFVVDNSTMTIYINGQRARSLTLASRREGVSYFSAWQESGETTCTFANSWVWSLPED